MSRSVQQEVLSKQREVDCLLHRLEGMTFHQIAQTVGYSSSSSALKAYRRGLDRLGMERAEEAFRIQCMRLDAMLVVLWPKVEQGDLMAISRALDVINAMNRLHGLDQARARPWTGTPAAQEGGAILVIDPSAA